MSSSKLVLKSTTSTSLNDRFSKLMKNRPDDSSRVRDHSPFSFYFNFFLGQSLVDKSGAVRPGSEKNRRFAEELERRSSVGKWLKRSFALYFANIFYYGRFFTIFKGQEIRRKPLSARIGDVGQGGARGFKQAIKRTPTKGGLAGRVGKRTEQNSNM